MQKSPSVLQYLKDYGNLSLFSLSLQRSMSFDDVDSRSNFFREGGNDVVLDIKEMQFSESRERYAQK